MRWLLPLLLAMTLALPNAGLAQQPVHDARPLVFRDTAEEARFHDLAAQLRCVQCQNQSLADSFGLLLLFGCVSSSSLRLYSGRGLSILPCIAIARPLRRR